MYSSHQTREGELGNSKNIKPINVQILSASEKNLSSDMQAKLFMVKNLDPTFDLSDFIKGAKQAFVMIIEAATKNDQETLEYLTSKRVIADFKEQNTSNQKLGHSINRKILDVTNVELANISINGLLATIGLKIYSDQIYIIKDQKGKIIHGDVKKVEHNVSNWTFSRHMSVDEIWKLVRTS